jgi:lysozyme
VLLIFLANSINRSRIDYSKGINHYHKLRQTQSEKNKIDNVFKKYNINIYGVDFSHYQGVIDWDKLMYIHDSTPITFVFLRATMGARRRDKHFKYNWEKAKVHGFVVGAYHYYRPNENSTRQANNFIKRVKLETGDLPPVLDIEKLSTRQSVKNLKIGLKNWLNIVEKHYGVKPIIYSGDNFYKKHLSSKEFEEYTIWIANFNKVTSPKVKKWKIWQFSEEGIIKGSYEKVDFNIFRGSPAEFEGLLIK